MYHVQGIGLLATNWEEINSVESLKQDPVGLSQQEITTYDCVLLLGKITCIMLGTFFNRNIFFFVFSYLGIKHKVLRVVVKVFVYVAISGNFNHEHILGRTLAVSSFIEMANKLFHAW